MMESKDFVSNDSSEFINENENLVFFNGKNFTFQLSVKEIHFVFRKLIVFDFNKMTLPNTIQN